MGKQERCKYRIKRNHDTAKGNSLNLTMTKKQKNLPVKTPALFLSQREKGFSLINILLLLRRYFQSGAR